MGFSKLVQFEPDSSFSSGDKTLELENVPAGISFSVEHLNPTASRRTQDGSLITQTIRYNKKNISLTFSFYDLTLKTYFEALYESGVQIVFSIWVENPTTFVEETEFTGTVQMLSLGEDMDQAGNIRTLNMTLAEA